MSKPLEVDPDFARELEQNYWDRRLLLLKVRFGLKLQEIRTPALEAELLMLESLREWLRTGRPFSLDSAKRLVGGMKKLRIT